MNAAARLARSSRVVLDAWRGIGRRRILAVFLLGCVLFLYNSAGSLRAMLRHPHFDGRIVLLSISFVRDQLTAFGLLACVSVAEHVAGRPARQTAYLVAIVVSAAFAGIVAMVPRAAAYGIGAGSDEITNAAQLAMVFVDAAWVKFFQWLILGGATTFIYVDRCRAQAARARLHAAELERTHAAQRTIESRLQAMQARVEPQFLFNTLGQVRNLYRDDALHGQRMLDELIAYLRAAMPKMRDTSSTVGQEVDLVRAYVAIVRLRLRERLDARIESAPDIGSARMPPMMLLPLIDHAIARGLGAAPARGGIRLRAAAADGQIRISVYVTGFLPALESEAIDGIRERLAALYGARAGLALQACEGQALEAVVWVPTDGVAAPV